MSTRALLHRASFTHFTLALESIHTFHGNFTRFTLFLELIHTCKGRGHSRSKRRVETSVVRSTPTHKPAYQSQYSVHDSLLQLLKTNCIISTSTVFQVRFWCRSYMWSCLQIHTQNRPRLNHKRLQSNKTTLYTKSAV
jgi:hypothetical protein